MALNLNVTNVRIVFLSIASDYDGANPTIHLNADWQSLDENGAVIDFVPQKKNNESRRFADYPADVRDAITTLTNYAEPRIKTANGI